MRFQCHEESGSAARALKNRGGLFLPQEHHLEVTALNLQHVASSDFIFYSFPVSPSSKQQTTAQKSNRLLKQSRLYITGTVTRQ